MARLCNQRIHPASCHKDLWSLLQMQTIRLLTYSVSSLNPFLQHPMPSQIRRTSNPSSHTVLHLPPISAETGLSLDGTISPTVLPSGVCSSSNTSDRCWRQGQEVGADPFLVHSPLVLYFQRKHPPFWGACHL